MSLLISGVLAFALAHLSLCLVPGIKSGIVNALGEQVWKRIFGSTILFIILVIIIGWRSTPIDTAYVPSYALRHVTMLLMLIAFILFGASKGATNIQRFIRHPMLTGVLVWSVAHLLSNGETRSIVLFSGFGVWALLEMILISKREGVWIKADVVPVTRTLRNLIISIIIFLLVFMSHRFFTGISLIISG